MFSRILKYSKKFKGTKYEEKMNDPECRDFY